MPLSGRAAEASSCDADSEVVPASPARPIALAGSAVCAAGLEGLIPRWTREPAGSARAPARGAAAGGAPRPLRPGRDGGRNPAAYHAALPVRPGRGRRLGFPRRLGAAPLLADAGRGVPGRAVARARAPTPA